MSVDESQNAEPQESTTISQQKYNDLYESELSDYEGNEKGGACIRNTSRLARYFEENGLPTDKMRLLYIIAPTPVGNDVIVANMQMLRDEEQQKLRLKNKEHAEWSYHATVLNSQNRVFDLSTKRQQWGCDLKTYMEKMFLDEKGNGNHYLRFIVTPIQSVFEISEQNKTIPITELIKRGNGINAGMSSIWMLQNKPPQEWFF